MVDLYRILWWSNVLNIKYIIVPWILLVGGGKT